MKRKKTLNLLKIYDKQSIFFFVRNIQSIIFFKKQKLKKLENFKKFSRLSNIAKFFFKCNSEFFNYKYQLVNIRFFFIFKKLINFIENKTSVLKFSKNSVTANILINFSKFLSRKNILSSQLENKNLFLILLKHLKWFFVSPISNIFLLSPFLNIKTLKFFFPNELTTFFFRLILMHYYDILVINKLQKLVLNNFSFKYIYLYKHHLNYMFMN